MSLLKYCSFAAESDNLLDTFLVEFTLRHGTCVASMVTLIAAAIYFVVGLFHALDYAYTGDAARRDNLIFRCILCTTTAMLLFITHFGLEEALAQNSAPYIFPWLLVCLSDILIGILFIGQELIVYKFVNISYFVVLILEVYIWIVVYSFYVELKRSVLPLISCT